MGLGNFSTGLSGLQASQRALEIVSHNVANANTPGYHRQIAHLATRRPSELQNLAIGTGVDVTTVRRMVSEFLEGLLRDGEQTRSATGTMLEGLRQLEGILQPGENGIDKLLNDFFVAVEELARKPEDLGLRRILLVRGAALTNRIRELDGDITGLASQLELDLKNSIAEINARARRIAEINVLIQRSEVRGIEANDLKDQRDQLIRELAQLADVRVSPGELGAKNVLIDGGLLVGGSEASDLRLIRNPISGRIEVKIANSETVLSVTGGRLGASLLVYNDRLKPFLAALDDLARGLAHSVDKIHSTGIGLNGGFDFVSGVRAVSDIGIPLEQSVKDWPLRPGRLFISISSTTTGQRELHSITVDPEVDSLSDVANAISAIPHLQAVVDPQLGRLQIIAEPGYRFDFAGLLPTQPPVSNMTGSAVVGLGGVYEGSENDELTFTIEGSGTVGLSPGLRVAVTNSTGGLIGSFSIGAGYEPNTFIEVGKGIKVKFSSGTVNNGEFFRTPVVGNADEVGLLVAAGIGTFFDGNSASTLDINPELKNAPELIAASRTGIAGEGRNLQRIIRIRNEPVMDNNRQTLEQFYSELVGNLGIEVRTLEQLKNGQDLAIERLEAERQSISGVDPNEELVSMMQFQRQFEMSAKYISILNDVLESLVNIL